MFKTTDQVIAALKAGAIKAKDAMRAARSTLSRYGAHGTYKELSYRTYAGPFKVRDGVFSTRNFYFDPLTLTATSYSWWSMLTVRNGKLIHNACGYSMQTSAHQGTLSRIMRELGIKPDITVYTRANIGSTDSWRTDLLTRYGEACVALKYCQTKSRKIRAQWVRHAEAELTKLQKAGIGLKFSKADRAKAVQLADQDRTDRLARKQHIKACRAEREAEHARETVNASNQTPLMVSPKFAKLSLVKG